MQFVSNGPEVPNDLIHLHEEGKVIFFTGAGISYPAGLPGFNGLTETVFKELSMTPNEVESAALDQHRYDTALGLLESRLVGARRRMREEVERALKPDLSRPNALRTHEALLLLGRNRNGALRLVTTNFDRLYHEANGGGDIPTFAAPFLPVPKNTWDGLVYLHGHLPVSPTEKDLNKLVITSGDFGIAYLAERWAARFVSELFRNYTVCFVGYSIEDPVLRYMMDALAADRLLGGNPLRMYAFANADPKNSERSRVEWSAKGVTPILYNTHEVLHDTIHAWAAIYRDGIQGKESLVSQLAVMHPQGSTQEDDLVGRMLWALSDPSGAPAKRFAEFEPAPPLAWLHFLSEERLGVEDLSRFGISSTTEDPPSEFKFSFLQRPSPYQTAPRQELVSRKGNEGGALDPSLDHLGKWLSRHASDPALVLWVHRNGGILHHSFAWHLKRELAEGKIPGPMKTIWRLAIGGQLALPSNKYEFLEWKSSFKKEGMTPGLRLWLRRLLSPTVHVGERSILSSGSVNPLSADKVSQIFETSVVLGGGVEKYSFRELEKIPEWGQALPSLADEATSLLRDALQLMEEIGLASADFDRSALSMPSIAEHDQNRYHDTWALLILLARDTWQSVLLESVDRARWISQGWAREKYPTFRRLVLFAATQEEVFKDTDGVLLLTENVHHSLWTMETRREAMRLLVHIAPRLNDTDATALQDAILTGPPRTQFRSDITDNDWSEYRDHAIWTRLAKYSKAGGKLNENAEQVRTEIEKNRPDFKLADDESDEFIMYSGGVTFNRSPSIHVPEEAGELAEYLLKNPSNDRWEQDDWVEECRRDLRSTSNALSILAASNEWPIPRWRDALYAWADEAIAPTSWGHVGSVVAKAPDPVIIGIGSALGFWLQRVAKTSAADGLFFSLARRVINPHRDEDVDLGADPIMNAINHPVGLATEAVFRAWYSGTLSDDLGLQEPVRSVFTALCDSKSTGFRAGRILLAAQAVSLYRVDPQWTREQLLPFFDWSRSIEDARGAWDGLLWSGNVYWPLLKDLKPFLFETVDRYNTIGDRGEQLASLLASIALSDSSPFDREDVMSLFQRLPVEGLPKVLWTIRRSLEGSGAQRLSFWEHRIRPFVRGLWPKSIEKNTPMTKSEFALLVVAMGASMATALTDVRDYVGGPMNGHVLHELLESKLCALVPIESLELLFRMDAPQDHWTRAELKKCLEAIAQADVDLQRDVRYQGLLRSAG